MCKNIAELGRPQMNNMAHVILQDWYLRLQMHTQNM
jgi:hypothetical protein